MPVDPLAGASPANIAAMIAGELAALAADAQTLGTRLSAGDVVAAVVLPSNGLTDLLQIGGLRVAAELPPTLLPGDVINVRVVDFQGDRINLQIVPPEDNAKSIATAAAAQVARIGKGAGPLAQAAAAVPRSPKAASTAPPAPAVSPPAAGAVPRGVAARASQPISSALEPIEARLAAAHATTPRIGGPPAPHSPSPTGPRLPQNGVDRSAPGSLPLAARPVMEVRPPPSPAVVPGAAASPLPAAGAKARTPIQFNEPAALLRALRLPVTATNIASARMALESPERLPNALATLSRALANTTDPRLATLSTLTDFVARLEPRSPVFATQIAAFVDHVVTGPEAKLARLAHDVPDAAPLAGRAAALRTALGYDLKSQLLIVAAHAAGSTEPQTAKSAALNVAVSGALTAITALQLNAAAVLATNPDGLSFTVPVALTDGFVQARIRIDRDAPEPAAMALDGDNFHLGFVLETQHLGTIGIDLVTVGRGVSLSLKTEGALGKRVFGKALGDLTARLEKLNYRIVRAEALIAPLGAREAVTPVAPESDPEHLVDMDA